MTSAQRADDLAGRSTAVVEPIWNAIRGTPRFRAMMAKMNLPS